MSLFQCEKCGCVENTATSNWAWNQCEGKPDLCSACDEKIGEWHGIFERRFFIKGSLFTNSEGNVQHRANGLKGKHLYDTCSSDHEVFEEYDNA